MTTAPDMTRAFEQLTLEDALAKATGVWSAGAGADMMLSMARCCVSMLGSSQKLCQLAPEDGARVIVALQAGRSPRTVSNYYGAFRRMLAISGLATETWPAPERASRRRTPPAADEATLERAISWLVEAGWAGTADLVRLIRNTGLSVGCEALRPDLLRLTPGEACDLLSVRGETPREVQVTDPETRALLRDQARTEALRTVTYGAHLKRIGKAAAQVGVGREALEPRALQAAFHERPASGPILQSPARRGPGA